LFAKKTKKPMSSTTPELELKVVLTSTHAKAPYRHGDSAGYDLYSAVNVCIPSALSPDEPAHILADDLFTITSFLPLPSPGRCGIPTHIKIQLPKKHCGRILSRSSLAKQGIDVVAGLIDEDYRGEIIVLLYNTSDRPAVIKKGAAIGQMLIEVIATPTVRCVDMSELSVTQRGDGGFGSTNVQ
jgi:dUTP pyrophosphatase